MGKTGRNAITSVGVSSLLTIFAVLCLVVFTLLTLSTVQAGQRLSDRAADAVLGYYQADFEAEQTLALLRAGIVPEGVRQAGTYFCYEHPISDTQTLAVEVELTEDGYRISRWQAVSTADWLADDRLPVWNGR